MENFNNAYEEAIANETDPAKKEALVFEYVLYNSEMLKYIEMMTNGASIYE